MRKKEQSEKAKIVSVTFPPVFLEEVDAWVDKVGGGRSEFIRSSINYYIANFLRQRYDK